MAAIFAVNCHPRHHPRLRLVVDQTSGSETDSSPKSSRIMKKTGTRNKENRVAVNSPNTRLAIRGISRCAWVLVSSNKGSSPAIVVSDIRTQILLA